MIERGTEAWPPGPTLIRATSRADVDRALARGSLATRRTRPLRAPGRRRSSSHGPPAQRRPVPDQRRPPPRLGGQGRPPTPHVAGPAQAQRAGPPRPSRGGGAPGETSARTTFAGIATSRELTLLQCLRLAAVRRGPGDRRLGAARTGSLDARAASLASVRGRRQRQGRRIGWHQARRAAGEPLRVRHARHLPSGPRPVTSTPRCVMSERPRLGAVPTWSTASVGSSSSATRCEWHGDRQGLPQGRPALHACSSPTAGRCCGSRGTTSCSTGWVRSVLCRAVGVDPDRTPRRLARAA